MSLEQLVEYIKKDSDARFAEIKTELKDIYMVNLSVKSIPLLAGQVVTIRSLSQGTTPTYYSDATTNYFSIIRSGNY